MKKIPLLNFIQPQENKSNRSSITVIYNAAMQHIEHKQFSNAIKLLNQALENDYHNTYLHYLRALAYYKQAPTNQNSNLLTNAFEDCKTILALEHQLDPSKQSDSQVIACAYHLRAKIYKHLYLPEESVSDLTHIIQHDMYRKEEAYVERGILHYRLKKYDAAIKDFTCAMTFINSEQYRHEPIYIKLLTFHGHTLLKQYYLNEALLKYEKAIELSADAVYLIALEKELIFHLIRTEPDKSKRLTLLNQSIKQKNHYLYQILFCKRGDIPCNKKSGEAKKCNKEFKKLVKQDDLSLFNEEDENIFFDHQNQKRFNFFNHKTDKRLYHIKMNTPGITNTGETLKK